MVTKQPADLGVTFPALVAVVDHLGNEVGGVPMVEIRVPPVTYTPWHVRTHTAGGVWELTDFYGTVIPLSATEAQPQRWQDPRPSVQRLYGSTADHLGKVKHAAGAIREQRLMIRNSSIHKQLDQELPKV
ncbi:hypothetical protein NKDENANG_00382 [Candidatus Entotheonellaceae bacterium PAL068K]